MTDAAKPILYRAFLSYSHRDRRAAKRWHKRLEAFPIDRDLIGRATRLGPVPAKLSPIFWDRLDFPASGGLDALTRDHLDQSAALILLASPRSAASRAVNEEVRYFRHAYPERPLVVILERGAGVAFRDCLPPALRFALDADGAVSTTPCDTPVAADPRAANEGPPRATAKVVAGLTGLTPDDVLGRVTEALRRERWMWQATVAGMAALLVIVVGGGRLGWDQFKQYRLDQIELVGQQKAALLKDADDKAARAKAEAEKHAAEIQAEADRRHAADRAEAAAREARAKAEADQRAAESKAEADKNAQRLDDTIRRLDQTLTAITIGGAEATRAITGFRNLIRPFNADIDRITSEALPGVLNSMLEELRKPAANPNGFEGAIGKALAQAKKHIDGLALDGAEKVLADELGRTDHLARGRAALLAERGRVARLKLRYREAVAFYTQASGVVAFDEKLAWRYGIAAADALFAQGAEFGDNPALSEAIQRYQVALRLAPRDRVPADWSSTQMRLANALWRLGERESGTSRLDQAVEAYRAALLERTRDRVPMDWAATQNNLGNALRILGERESGTARLDEAVKAYRAALLERTRDRVPMEWAATQNNLGNALRTLGERESGTARLDEAVGAYRAALLERTRGRVPLDWAMTQSNLGLALWALGSRESGTARLDQAVEAYRAALLERSRDRVPLDWATTHNNLGVVLWTLGSRESGTARLQQAVEAYRAALLERTRDRVPLQWATTQSNLGVALWTLGSRESGTARLEQAVEAYRAALLERTRDRVPQQWAMTQNNLGSALWTLGSRESGTARLEQAVEAYRAALLERTRDRVPLQWATTQNNLGLALQTLGSRQGGMARLDQAVEAYRAALLERTRDRVPVDWAQSQLNLANTLALLAQRSGDRGTLVEAIGCMRVAAEVYREGDVTYWLPVAERRVREMEAALAAMPR